MTLQQLPERANLEQLKKQAKSLLRSAHNQDRAALKRFEAVLLGRPLDQSGIALHDAQFVIAREYGFKSWNELREHVEERSLSFSAAVDEFVRCATGGAKDRALRLLKRHEGIARANLVTELALGDADAVVARLKAAPELAVQAGGVQNWEPLLYVCHTCLHRGFPQRADGLVRISRELLSRGANPTAEYRWNWHPELPRTVLWGALIDMDHAELAEVLLENGANPTDGVSVHIAAGSGNVRALELLNRFGVNVNGVSGGVPPLRYILGWAVSQAIPGIRWLLQHGADPNLVWAQSGDAALHIAAQRWDVAMVELLVSHGADIHQRRSDGRTPYTIAALHGNYGTALSDIFTIYIPDRRGRGLSGPHGNYSLERESEDISAVVRASGSESIFGLSSGAIVTLQTATNEPAIKNVILYEPPIPLDGYDPTRWVNRYKKEIAEEQFGAALLTVAEGTNGQPC